MEEFECEDYDPSDYELMTIGEYIEKYKDAFDYDPMLSEEYERMAWDEYGADFMQFCEEYDLTPVAEWVDPDQYKPAKLPIFGKDEYGTMLYSVDENWKVGTNGEMLYFDHGLLTSTPYECTLPNPHTYDAEEVKSHIIHTDRVKVLDRVVNVNEGFVYPSANEHLERDKFVIYDTNYKSGFDGDFVLYRDILVYRDYNDGTISILGDLYEDINELVEEQTEEAKNIFAILKALDREATEYENWEDLYPDSEILDEVDPTPKNMSKFFGKSEKTFFNWRKTNPRLYLACEEFMGKH